MSSLRVPLILFLGFLSLGTVVLRKDAIRRTQTDPVAYEEKKKEEQEGKKGPPAPTFKLYPKEKFLVEGPIEEDKIKEEELKTEKTKGEFALDWDTGFEDKGEEEFKPEGTKDDTSDTAEGTNALESADNKEGVDKDTPEDTDAEWDEWKDSEKTPVP